MTDTQYQVQQAIDRLVEYGAEQGLQVAVYRNGELVVDAVAGVADPTTGRPVTSDTLFFSYSLGKGVASTVVHVLAERGILDYDTRIAELWPEFGCCSFTAAPLTPQCGAGRRPGLRSQLHRSQSGPLRRARAGFPSAASERLINQRRRP